MSHSGMLYQLDISMFYFYEPLLFSDFFPLEIYKNLDPPLSSITFTVTQIYFNKYIYLFWILYSMKSVF